LSAGVAQRRKGPVVSPAPMSPATAIGEVREGLVYGW
jgi:hypothetical protein